MNLRTAALAALVVMTAAPASAQAPTNKDALLDHLAGNWVLQGVIAGRETIHDIAAQWILNGEYLRLQEVSREKNAQGNPAYEAVILIEWEAAANQYRCLWLDSTGGGGLAVPAAEGKRAGEAITFHFKDGDKDSGVETSFVYNKTAGTWAWLIDNEEHGKLTRFARVTLTRK